MHKFFEKKPPKIKQKTAAEDSDLLNSDGDDPDMDTFADKAIEDKMRELNAGAGLGDESDDEI